MLTDALVQRLTPVLTSSLCCWRHNPLLSSSPILGHLRVCWSLTMTGYRTAYDSLGSPVVTTTLVSLSRCSSWTPMKGFDFIRISPEPEHLSTPLESDISLKYLHYIVSMVVVRFLTTPPPLIKTTQLLSKSRDFTKLNLFGPQRSFILLYQILPERSYSFRPNSFIFHKEMMKSLLFYQICMVHHSLDQSLYKMSTECAAPR